MLSKDQAKMNSSRCKSSIILIMILVIQSFFVIFAVRKVSGEVLWKCATDGTIVGVGVSADGKYVVAATENRTIFFFDGRQSVRWKYHFGVDIECVAISGDGSRVVVGIDEYRSGLSDIYLFDDLGNIIWKKDLVAGSWPCDVTISPDAEYIVTGDTRSTVYFYNISGSLIWTYSVAERVVAVSTSFGGKYTAAGSWDNSFYFFNKTGDLLWSHDLGYIANAVSVSPEGEYVAAGSSSYGAEKMFLFDRNGNLLLQTPIYRDIGAVSVSANAEKIACSNGHSWRGRITIINKTADVILQWEGNGSVEDVAITSDGKFVAFGCGEYLYVLEAFSDVDPSTEANLLSDTSVTLYWHKQQWFCEQHFPSIPSVDTLHYFMDMVTPTSDESKRESFNPGVYTWWGGWGAAEGYWGVHTGKLSSNTVIEKGLWNLSIWVSANEPSQRFIVDLCYWDENHSIHPIESWKTGNISSTTPVELAHSFNLSTWKIPKGSYLGFVIVVGPDSNVNLFFGSTLHPSYLRIPRAFVDDVPPEIRDVAQHPLEDIQPSQNVTVTVTAIDYGSGVHNVTLLYSTENETTWTPLNMVEIDVNTYETEIQGHKNGTWVRYKITTYDNAGNHAVDDNAGDYYVYQHIARIRSTWPTTIGLWVLIVAVAIAAVSGVALIVRNRKRTGLGGRTTYEKGVSVGDDRAIDRSVGQIATSEQVRDIYQRANDLYEKRDYLGAIVLYDKLLAASRVTPRLVNPYDVRRSRAMAYCKVGRFVEAEQELKQLLDILRSHGGSVSGSQVMYWYLVAHYKGNEKKAMDEWLRL